MEQQAKEFFLRYEMANSTSDVSAIGDLYADTFMFGGPSGTQAVNQEDFLRVIPKMQADFLSMGLAETRLQTVEATLLSSKFVLAKTAWRMTIRNSSGDRHADAFATYILMRGQADVLSIVFQIDHQDLATVLKDQPNTR